MSENKFMTVTVRNRSAEAPWGYGPTSPVVEKIQISVNCPKCGKRRGEPFGMNQCDDGAFYWVQGWNNPCGHLDRYENVIKEAAELAKAQATASPLPAGSGGESR